MEGTQLGQFRVVRQIGEGGMASVWLAEHTLLGRRAAIKVLLPTYSRDPVIVTRFFNEARAATTISDPGIVQIFDFGYHVDGSAYLVMELLEGETLAHRLQRVKRLPALDAMRLMRQIASSLGAAHRAGIVHRDLKPENIFVVPDPEVLSGERAKIVDFGIAKLAGESGVKTQTHAVMGTPAYMSPEQCQGAGQVDQRTDIYALGCVLYTMMTGRPPFIGEGTGDLIAKHMRDVPVPPSAIVPDVSPDADYIVMACLEKDPARRPASGAELAAMLGRIVGSQPIIPVTPLPSGNMSNAANPTTLSSASGASLSGRPAVRVGASRTALLGAIGVAIAAVAFAIIVVVSSRGHGHSSNEPAAASSPAERVLVLPATDPAPRTEPAAPSPAPAPVPAAAPVAAAPAPAAAETAPLAAKPAPVVETPAAAATVQGSTRVAATPKSTPTRVNKRPVAATKPRTKPAAAGTTNGSQETTWDPNSPFLPN